MELLDSIPDAQSNEVREFKQGEDSLSLAL